MKEDATSQEQYFCKDENGNIVPVSLDEIKQKNHLHHLSHHHSTDGTPADDPARVAKIKTVAEAEAQREKDEANGVHHHHHHHHHESVGIVPDNPKKDYTSSEHHHHHHHHESVGIVPANPSKERHHHHHHDATGEFRKAMTSHITRKKLLKKWGWRFLVLITMLVVCAVIAVYWFDPDGGK